jgi:hypothetical protein
MVARNRPPPDHQVFAARAKKRETYAIILASLNYPAPIVQAERDAAARLWDLADQAYEATPRQLTLWPWRAIDNAPW